MGSMIPYVLVQQCTSTLVRRPAGRWKLGGLCFLQTLDFQMFFACGFEASVTHVAEVF